MIGTAHGSTVGGMTDEKRLDILRTLLFAPGNRERMLAGAAKAGADAVVIDLEDAVPAGEKKAARKKAREALLKLAGGGATVLARVNNVHTGLARADVMAVVRPGLAGVVHPKTSAAQDLWTLDVLLREAEMRHGVRPGDIRVIPLIEGPRGVLRCEEIAGASDRVDALSVGGEDFTAEMGIERYGNDAGLAYIRHVVATVAASLGIFAIDTPWSGLGDAKGLAAEARLAKSVGFRGKYVIHPSQVAPVNGVFSPSKYELAQARAVIAAASAAAKLRRGSVALDGRMVDAPVVARAERALALAAAIQADGAAAAKRPGRRTARG